MYLPGLNLPSSYKAASINVNRALGRLEIKTAPGLFYLDLNNQENPLGVALNLPNFVRLDGVDQKPHQKRYQVKAVNFFHLLLSSSTFPSPTTSRLSWPLSQP